MLPYAPTSRSGALSAEDSYAQISELGDIEKNKGLSTNAIFSFFRAIVTKVLRYISDDKQHTARDIMRQLVCSDDRLTYDEGVNLLTKLRACAHPKDRYRFYCEVDNNNNLRLKINLKENVEGIEKRSADAALPSESIHEEVNTSVDTENGETEIETFSLSFEGAVNEWDSVKLNNPDLFKQEGNNETSLPSQPERPASISLATDSSLPSATNSQTENAETPTECSDGCDKQRPLSVTIKPLPMEVKSLCDAMAETTDKSSQITLFQEKDHELICTQIKQFKGVKERVPTNEQKRFKIKFINTHQIELVIHLEPYFDTPEVNFNTSASRKRQTQIRRSQLKPEIQTWRSVVLNRGVIRRLIAEGIFKADEIKGWKNTDQFFNSAIEYELSNAMGDADYCSDIDEVYYGGRTEADAKKRKVDICVKAVKAAKGCVDMQVAMAEYGHETYDLEDVIHKLENTKMFEFNREPVTEAEQASAETICDRGDFHHLYSEDITEEVIAQLRLGAEESET